MFIIIYNNSCNNYCKIIVLLFFCIKKVKFTALDSLKWIMGLTMNYLRRLSYPFVYFILSGPTLNFFLPQEMFRIY